MVGLSLMSELFPENKCPFKNTDARIEENSRSIDKTRKEVDKLDRELKRIGSRMEDMQEWKTLFSRSRERDQWKLNLILHGVEEATDEIKDLIERLEADRGTFEQIFKAIRAKQVEAV
jgi:hypothetical protein